MRSRRAGPGGLAPSVSCFGSRLLFFLLCSPSTASSSPSGTGGTRGNGLCCLLATGVFQACSPLQGWADQLHDFFEGFTLWGVVFEYFLQGFRKFDGFFESSNRIECERLNQNIVNRSRNFPRIFHQELLRSSMLHQLTHFSGSSRQQRLSRNDFINDQREGEQIRRDILVA